MPIGKQKVLIDKITFIKALNTFESLLEDNEVYFADENTRKTSREYNAVMRNLQKLRKEID